MSMDLHIRHGMTVVGLISLLLATAGIADAQTGGRQPAGPARVADNRPQRVQPQPRAPFQLTRQQQAYVDRVLEIWEQRSGRVKRYRCNFTQYEYGGAFGPKDPDTAGMINDGIIKYAAPDKGLYQVKTIKHYTPPKKPGDRPTYEARPGEHGDHWVSDGKSIIVMDPKKKQVLQMELPPELQGTGIVDGPLPFLFGAKKEKIKERFWVRMIPPPEKDAKEYWLQAFPKTRKDAANFLLVEVILDEKLFLPQAIQVYDPSFNNRKNFARTVYVFSDRKVNELLTPANLNLFSREFYEFKVPSGWKLVKERHVPPQPARLPPARTQHDQARRPGVYNPRQ